MRELTLQQLTRLIDEFDRAGIHFWVDGGWSIDSLVGHQTRPHEDLDIAIELRFVQRAIDVLEGLGFTLVIDHDTKEWNFVYRHSDGRQVDFHVITIDESGDGIYGPVENGQRYPALALTGVGAIAGRCVRCISLAGAVAFRTGWALRERDCADLRTLQDHFDISLPSDFAQRCG